MSNLCGTVGFMATADLDAPALTGIRRLSALDTVRARIALAIELGLLKPGSACRRTATSPRLWASPRSRCAGRWSAWPKTA